MSQNAVTSHGTLLYRNGTLIGELGDIAGPGLTRNEFDATTHNRDIDNWVMGVLRREPITFPVFFNKTVTTHGISAGLLQAIKDGSLDEWKATFPDGGVWLGSGFTRQVTPADPVDGIQTANITVRLTGPMYIDGTLIGADAS